MKVLFATSEFADFAKAGGLGDVSAGLPRALRCRDIDIRVLLPAYPEVIAKATDITIVAHLPGRAGIEPCCIGQTFTNDGLPLFLVLEPRFISALEVFTQHPKVTIGPTTMSGSHGCHWLPRKLPLVQRE